MNVLIACEFSGIVREAFRKRGHNAWSCDILPAEDKSSWHFQEDVRCVLSRMQFDLMIAHPPCTYLANSGARWLYGGKGSVPDIARWADMESGAKFYDALLNERIARRCIENPIMHSHARRLIRVPLFEDYIRQTIQPWQFGHGEIKATCLDLVNLPALVPTKIVDGRQPRVHHASPGPDRWKERSRTLQGIADAMAEQWGSL